MKKIKIKVAFKDHRGEIMDLIQGETLNAVTLVTINKGAVRGNHYHQKTIQWTYMVYGSMKFVSQIPGKKPVITIMKKGDMLMSQKNERHAMVGLEDSAFIALTKGPRGGKDYEVDTFRLKTPLIS